MRIVTFKNRRVVEPGAYSQILGGSTQSPDVATTGNVMIIDDGIGAGYGYGSGINGQLASALGSIYAFDRLDDFQKAVRGGALWEAAKLLFNPSRDSRVKGCNRLFYVTAATTVKSTITFSWTGGYCITAGIAGGTITFHGVTEGVRANGALTSSILTTGFAMKMVAGTIDNTKFMLQLWQGTYKGLDDDNVPFDDIAAASTQPSLLAQSPEFTNIADVITWAKTDAVLNQYYIHGTSTVTGTGVVDATDLANNTGYKLSVGGTTTYNAADYTSVLDAIKEVDNTFFLSCQYGDNAQNLKNSQLLAHMQTQAEFDKFMVVGGGADATKLTQTNGSIPSALFFNSEKVYVAHSSIRVPSSSAALGYKVRSTFYHAAAQCGRMAGLEPQTPLTWKDLNVIGVTHEMTLNQREQCLLAGVLHLKNVAGLGWVVNQDVNTLQKNSQEINEDGTSFEGSLMRIAAILNKELTINLRAKFTGKNVATASPADVKTFVEGYLQFRTANKQTDNLIILGKNVNVQLKGSDYDIKYSFVGNGPINRLFTSGFMLDINLSA